MSCTQAQRVESAAYDLMLKGLLDNSVPEKTVKEIGDPASFVVLDAREAPEYAVSHLQDAQWVGYDDFSLERVANLPKDKPILVYCSVGYRSEKISEKLLAEGFQEVYNLYGGIFEWMNQEKPLVNSANQPTEKVHAYNQTWGTWLRKGEKVYE
ncbi:MAG: rhodanese-like domain-containing protein [Bacteroidota bacterium]